MWRQPIQRLRTVAVYFTVATQCETIVCPSIRICLNGYYCSDSTRVSPILGLFGAASFEATPRLLRSPAPRLLRLALKAVLRYRWDYWNDDLGSDYDAAFVFNIIHVTIARRTTGCSNVSVRLQTGWPNCRPQSVGEICSNACRKTGIGFVGLTYLTTLGAELHPYDDVREWLDTARFENVRRSPLLPSCLENKAW